MGSRARPLRAGTFTDRDRNTWPATLFGQHDAGGGPYPGVLWCATFSRSGNDRECGPVVLGGRIAGQFRLRRVVRNRRGDSVPHTIDATDFLVSTPSSPTGAGSSTRGGHDSIVIGSAWSVARRRGRRAERRQQRSPLRHDRGLGSGGVGVLRGHHAAGPDDDPGRGLHVREGPVPRARNRSPLRVRSTRSSTTIRATGSM